MLKIYIGLSFILLISCKKDDMIDTNYITGTWHLERSRDDYGIWHQSAGTELPHTIFLNKDGSGRADGIYSIPYKWSYYLRWEFRKSDNTLDLNIMDTTKNLHINIRYILFKIYTLNENKMVCKTLSGRIDDCFTFEKK